MSSHCVFVEKCFTCYQQEECLDFLILTDLCNTKTMNLFRNIFQKTDRYCNLEETRAFVHLVFKLKEPTKPSEIKYTRLTLSV